MKTTASVTIKLKVHLTQPWGQDCPIAQVYKQAKAEAIDITHKLLSSAKNVQVLDVDNIHIHIDTYDYIDSGDGDK